MGRLVGVCFGILAAAIELPAVALLFVQDVGVAVYLAPYAHLLAAMNCKVASDLFTGNPLGEQDAVWWAAFCVPVFGPCLAWLFPRRRGGAAVLDAQAPFASCASSASSASSASFLQFDDRGQRAAADVACRPKAWETDADRPRPMSFAEILRHGSPDHKRDAVRMLAEVGDERHLRLLREVLVSETGELRLCAFVELDRATRRYTSRIEELRTQLQLRPDDPELVAPIAEAHRALARSGLLDAEMERYHLRQASGFAQRAFSTQPDPETSRVYARILCDQGEYQPAADCLADLDDDARDAYPTRVLRARIGLNRREFGVVRDEARAIARGGHKLPEWLAVFGQDHADGESTNEVRWPVHLK